MNVDKIQSRRCAPVPEQARLDLIEAQRLAQQGVVLQINLADGKIVRGAPPGVHSVKQFGRERLVHNILSLANHLDAWNLTVASALPYNEVIGQSAGVTQW